MAMTDKRVIRLAEQAASAGRPCPGFGDADLDAIARAAYDAAPRPPGRPPVAEADRRRKRAVRFSDREWAEVVAEAKRRGVAARRLVRDLVLELLGVDR